MGNMDALPLSRRQALVVAGVGALLLLVAGRFFAQAGAARPAEPVARAVPVAAPSARQVVVHVVGAVRRPGLLRLREGSRVADAVARAGGATKRADLALVNLAAPVSDGSQIVVPMQAQPPGEAGVEAAGEGPGGAAVPAGPVHLNTATLEELDALPGVGPVTAQKILDYRQQHGAFGSVDDLDAIPGIGPTRLEQLRELVAP